MHRSSFTVTFVATPGVDGIKAFRMLLKAALRTYGLRAIDVRELQDERARPTRENSDELQSMPRSGRR